jgi:Zn-dependent protease
MVHFVCCVMNASLKLFVLGLNPIERHGKLLLALKPVRVVVRVVLKLAVLRLAHHFVAIELVRETVSHLFLVMVSLVDLRLQHIGSAWNRSSPQCL